MHSVSEPADDGKGEVLRYRKVPERPPAKPTEAQVLKLALLPAWLKLSVPAADVRDQRIKPSGAVDPAATWSGVARRHAIKRGNTVHRLMQSLPDIAPEHRAEAARRYLARQNEDFDEAERDDILRGVLGILDDQRFAALFAPGSRAEVPIVGRIGDQPVSGTVDRLVVAPDAIEIVDYKTNRQVPATLEQTKVRHPGYVRQLALYRAVLMKLYPNRSVRCALLWTGLPALQQIPAEVLDQALATLPRP
jgi:ATP-dependent helicase/nuclease subunit A